MEKPISLKYAEAIKAINNVGAVVSGNTKEEIEINWLNQNPISIETIENKINEIENNEILKKEQEESNKQSALNKLKALGLNDAEIKSIIGN
jgi:hypothetical protein